MNDDLVSEDRTIPASAQDAAGTLLSPDDMPLSALMDVEEIERFAEYLAELTQTECSVLLYHPDEPRSLTADRPIQRVRAPICLVLNRVACEDCPQCLRDVHQAALLSLQAGEPVVADCVGGESTLYACPIVLGHHGSRYPKAGIVAAAQDIYNFHFADRLAAVLQQPVEFAEGLMCRTDKRCLNSAQLRRVRAMMGIQAESFSRQISLRYAEYESMSTIIQQRRELHKAYRELDREFEIVGEIQQTLVPRDPPRIPGFATATYYKPAQQAGGDYFDFFPLKSGAWTVLIADVAGHGPPAAVVMAIMRAILHAWPEELDAPVAVAQRLNEILLHNSMDVQFMTALLGVLEPVTGRFRFVSAGHHAPMVARAGRGSAEEIEFAAGLPLGAVEDARHELSEATIDPGDVLLLYTDGISDTLNPRGELYGQHRLADAFAQCAAQGADAIVSTLIDHVFTFSEFTPPPDDQTLVVFERLGPGDHS